MLNPVMGALEDVRAVGLMVLVVDTQRLRGEATAAALSSVGVPATFGEAGAGQADVALVHHSVPDSDELHELFADGDCRTLFLAGRQVDDRDPRLSHAYGVLSGDGLTVETLSRAVTEARAGRRPKRWKASEPTSDADLARALVATLSPRERSILRLVATARRNEEIGAELQISANTVRTHVQNILGKLGVGSRVAAVAVARRGGLDLESSSQRGAS